MPDPAPISVDAAERDAWSDAAPLLFRAAAAWARYAPRGSSWLPRKLGRAFGGNWRLLVEAPGGVKLAADPANLDIYTTLLSKRSWEPLVVRTCAALLEPGEVFCDIGANAGYVGLAVARAHGDRIRVFAFEPQPGLARVAAISAAVNGIDSTVLQMMLGADDRTADLYVPSHAVHASSVTRERNARRISCAQRRLDGLIEAGTIPVPDVVKIDVEGAELDVLKGAERLLRDRAPYVVFETDENMARFGYDRSDLVEYLHSLGRHEVVAIVEGGVVPLASEDAAKARDLLAVPTDRGLPSTLRLRR